MSGYLRHGIELTCRLNVEHYAGGQCLHQFLVPFARACEADAGGGHAGVERFGHFASGGDIESVDQRCKMPEQRRHRVGLDGIVQANCRRQRGAQRRNALADQLTVVGVKRRAAGACSQTAERYAAYAQFAVNG